MTFTHDEIAGKLIQCRDAINLLEEDFAKMRDPDFDPLTFDTPLIPRAELTSEKVLDILHHESVIKEAEVQDELVESCVERLQIAMRLIETQIALSKRLDVKKVFTDKATISGCVSEDMAGVSEIYKQIETLHDYNSAKNLPVNMNEDWVELTLGKLTAKHTELARGKVNTAFHSLTKERLLGDILEARMDYANLATVDVGFAIQKTHNAMDNALLLKVAFDEGALERSDRLLYNSMNGFMAYATNQLKAAKDAITAIEEFLEDLPNDGQSRYRPVSINRLGQLAP